METDKQVKEIWWEGTDLNIITEDDKHTIYHGAYPRKPVKFESPKGMTEIEMAMREMPADPFVCQMPIRKWGEHHQCECLAKYKTPLIENNVEFICGIHKNKLHNLYKLRGDDIRCIPVIDMRYGGDRDR